MRKRVECWTFWTAMGQCAARKSQILQWYMQWTICSNTSPKFNILFKPTDFYIRLKCWPCKGWFHKATMPTTMMVLSVHWDHISTCRPDIKGKTLSFCKLLETAQYLNYHAMTSEVWRWVTQGAGHGNLLGKATITGNLSMRSTGI